MSEDKPPTDDEVDAELKLAIFGYDPDENYPDFGCASMREAYRAGWEDGRNVTEGRYVEVNINGTRAWHTENRRLVEDRLD